MGFHDPKNRTVSSVPLLLRVRWLLFFRRCFAPAVEPEAVQQLAQPNLYLLRCPFSLEVPQRVVMFDYHVPGNQLPLHIIEEVFSGNLVAWSLDPGRDYPTNDLDHVVQQETQGKLKNRSLRRARDQSREPKHFRHLLKYLFDAPTLQIDFEHVRGRELVVSDGPEDNVLLARSFQRNRRT